MDRFIKAEKYPVPFSALASALGFRSADLLRSLRREQVRAVDNGEFVEVRNKAARILGKRRGGREHPVVGSCITRDETEIGALANLV